MEAIVRRAVKDPGSVEALSHEEGRALESATAPRRRRRIPEQTRPGEAGDGKRS
jgi:hypothetical protein